MANVPIMLWIIAFDTLVMFYLAAVSRFRSMKTIAEGFRSVRIVLVKINLNE